MPNIEDEFIVPPPQAAGPADGAVDPLHSILERLEKLGRLPEGWSEYGSPAISPVAIATARELVQRVPELNPAVNPLVSAPVTVAPLDGGGVLVEYKGPRLDLEIDIGRDGSFGYLLADERTDHPSYEEGDEATWDSILALVRRVLVA
jgi:hypothetical protein